MGGLVEALFGDPGKAAREAAAKQQQITQLAQTRSEQEAKDEAARASGQLAGVKTVRGQRLLVSKDAGGLADTVGGA